MKKEKTIRDKAMRHTGIEIVGDMPWGTHFCQFYKTKEDLIDVLVPYFREGLLNNEKCIWVTSGFLNDDEAITALLKVVPSIQKYIKSGQIEIFPYTNWYLKHGKFDLKRVLAKWVKKHDEAIRDGYEGIRVTGNPFWIDNKKDWNDFAEYDAEINNIIDDYNLLILCTYSLEKCNSDAIFDVVANHEFALTKRDGKWKLIENSEHKKTGQALLESEKKYRSLFDQMSEGFALHEIICDKSGKPIDYRFINVNPGFEKLTGLKAKNINGKLLSDVLPNEDPKWLREYGEVALTGKPARFESYSPTLKRYYNVFAYSTNPGQFAVIFSDITDRKLAEIETATNLMKYSVLFNSIPVGVSVTDRKGNIIETNEETSRILEESRESIMGRKIGHPKWKSIYSDGKKIKPDEFPSLTTLHEKRIVDDFEMGLVKEKNKITWISVSSQPIQKIEDYGVLTTYIDITKRKLAENELKKLQQQMTAILENIDGGFIALNKDWKYTFINKKAANNLFKEPEDLIGKNIWTEFPKLLGTSIEKNFRKVMHTNVPMYYEEKGIETDRWYENHIYPIPEGIAIFWSDITARKRAELENALLSKTLKKEDRRKNEFIAILGHELRNPLALLSASIQIQRESLEKCRKGQKFDKKLVFEANEISAEQINTMSTLLNDLLDISRISRGKIQLRKEKIPLNSIIKKAMNSVLPNIVAKNHILKEELAGENIVLYADPVRIEQIIVNLLNNAAKYTDPKGKIVIKTSFDNNFAIISIRDTGIGIPNNQLDEIFEPFVQLSTAQKKSQGGLGIGLMLSKQLAELHGGDIKAKSNGMNKGSEFIVQIPADLKHRNHSRIRQENKNEGKTTKKVLLVDDNTRIAELFSKLLSQFGYLTKTAFEGESAIKISKSFNPDIILLDIGLPGIDGHETARLLRKQHRNNPSLKIIAISGYGTSEDKKKSKEAGCDAHITKPVNANKLREIIEAI